MRSYYPHGFLIRASVFILLVVSCVVGCIPYVYEYYRPMYPSGAPLSSGRCSGPKDTIRIPYHGLFVSVQIRAKYHLPPFAVVFYVPGGMKARLTSNIAKLILRSDNREDIKTIVLIGAHGEATEWMIGATHKRETSFRELEWYKDFPFHAKVEPQFDEQGGTLILPDVVISGTLEKGLEVPFRRERSLEFDALNC